MSAVTESIEQTFISPGYLAGSGDPAWVTVPLRRASGWSTAGDPLVPRVILTSPDQLAQLRIAPDPDPAEPWWSLRHAHHGDQRAWEITFDAQTPVEIIAAVTDTFTAPAPPPTASVDPYGPLRAAGWHAPRHHDGLTSPKGMSSPNGLARVDRIVDESGRSAGWVVETSVHHLPAIWRAYVDGNTPSHVTSALFGALADTAPLVRHPHRVPSLAVTHGSTSTRQVSAESVAFALRDRTTALAQRNSAWPPSAPPAPPHAPTPRRTR
ncbi:MULTISPECIES: DUF317 domain-containing protein [Streptomyces]|uniref:DUF317 domain-containing protein n=1 Tax=Streptomyces nanshensis TaxID=518642 RepID=A0A1E7M0N2_9ACTN|nr:MULTISPECIES: DUF317 domain-containing protein [Streptomyces]OEV22025.1 hypothetical protein AN221_03615 [Streptomyces nanshensis]RDV48392.1 DUF317 domain-containing protein [Streptomyces sp. IB2014 011-12]